MGAGRCSAGRALRVGTLRAPEAACAYGRMAVRRGGAAHALREHGGQPGHAAWHDEHANRLTNGFFRDTWEAIERAYVRPRHRGFVPFQEAAGRTIHALLRGEGTREGCVATLEELVAAHR